VNCEVLKCGVKQLWTVKQFFAIAIFRIFWAGLKRGLDDALEPLSLWTRPYLMTHQMTHQFGRRSITLSVLSYYSYAFARLCVG